MLQLLLQHRFLENVTLKTVQIHIENGASHLNNVVYKTQDIFL